LAEARQQTKVPGKIGAVMVVGAGIGGMQAALDLANSGFRVYLVEETSAIGGRMAQLDKTFPTNDCSMCTISPRLVEVDKHTNIDILTNAEVVGLEGEAGNFRVHVLQKPRFVDLVKCNACGDCIQACPVELPSEFDQGLNTRRAIGKRYPQAIPNAYAIEKRGVAPCKAACPSNIHVQGYIQLIAKGKYREALALIRKDCPFPAVCGRVCTRPCEDQCTRGDVDEPVAIDSIKRFVADLELIEDEPYLPEVPEKREEKVAVVGAGPAGLSCAYYLALEGYGVTVFEALPVAGGMLRVGIPPYRLPHDVLEKEIGLIQRLGVEILTGISVGKDITLDELRQQGYRALFLGTGAHRSLKLAVPGEELEGVFPGVEFLRDVNMGRTIKLGPRVAVVGGGNVAMDACRTALRVGAQEVTVLYRRTQAEMPAHGEEIHEALEEGVQIAFLAAPVRIEGQNGRVKSVECIRMKLAEPDESGRRRPVPIPGSEFTLEVDAVIPAIGQLPDLSFLNGDEGLDVTRRNTLQVDPVTFATNVEGVFAGGDNVTGPATVIEAIAAGKNAAVSIHRYLRGQDMAAGRGKRLEPVEAPTDGVSPVPRQGMPRLEPEKRRRNYEEVQLGFRKDQVMEEARRCLNCGICSECLECVKVCQPGAIDHSMESGKIEIPVGAIIMVPGYQQFDPHIKGEYGYGRMENVVSSLEFERILSASGPFDGEIKRLSDGRHPRKIAWIQCVGSRDVTCSRDYCSSVCCMYATKEAIIAREHDSRIEATIFYNDIRAFGKGFEFYYESAEKSFGVRYIKGIVSAVKEMQRTKNLRIRYAGNNGEMLEEEFDMVVLSTGLVPSSGVKQLAAATGLKLNRFDFCQSHPFTPNQTNRPGIYVAGAFESPMDIPESVMGASSATALAGALLADVRGTLVRDKQYPSERDVSAEEPRIGVFVCHCGTNIARVVDVADVTEYVRTLPHVVHAENNLYTCSTDATRHIAEVIREHNLNRVVVASCTPRTHEPLFRDTMREAGINKYLFEMANIRDQCSWVHADEPQKATAKSKDLARMAVARAAALKPIQEMSFPVEKRGLVFGGGLAGITAVLSLARQGFDATLVECTDHLGGQLNHLHYTIEGEDVQPLLEDLLHRVEAEPRVRVLLNTRLVDFGGHVGRFTATVESDGRRHELVAGAVIVATGGVEYEPREYLYGQTPRVMTQNQMEEALAAGNDALEGVREVVMIQCVGSREPEHLYCSRVCCAGAVKNALKIKTMRPETNVYVLYRDVRTYGFHELAYREAREAGVIFLRYHPERKPDVQEMDGRLNVRVYDELLGEEVVLYADRVVLSAAIRPHPESEHLGVQLKVPRDEDGFFMEAHMKLRPLDFASEGMYLAGLAHAPKLIGETIAQARGAAARAATILARDHLTIRGEVSVVDPSRCVACLTCVRVCPYDVPELKKGVEGAYMGEVAYIDPASCQGCGICTSACPRKAISLQHYTDEQILAKVSAL